MTGGKTMTADNIALTRRWFEEVWNQGRTETIYELFAADGRIHGVGGPGDTAHGPEGFRAIYDKLKGALPDIRFTLDEVIGERDLVAVRWTARATHAGDHLGVPATNKPVTFTGMGFGRFHDDKLVESWNNWDMLGMLQAIGHAPQSGF